MVPIQVKNAVTLTGLGIDPLLRRIAIPAVQEFLPIRADAIRAGNSWRMKEPFSRGDEYVRSEVLEIDFHAPVRSVARLLHAAELPIERTRRESLLLRKREFLREVSMPHHGRDEIGDPEATAIEREGAWDDVDALEFVEQGIEPSDRIRRALMRPTSIFHDPFPKIVHNDVIEIAHPGIA